MNKIARPEYVASLEDKLAKRHRLVIAALLVGLVIGFVFHAIISMPPVWIHDLEGCM